jgi:hypothetical protein
MKETLREPDLFEEIVNRVWNNKYDCYWKKYKYQISNYAIRDDTGNIGNPYYEAFNIIFSVDNTLMIQKKWKRILYPQKTL